MPRVDTAHHTAKEYADTIPVADTAGHWNRHGRRPAKRNRKWERTHRPYRYVNVPLELREQVLALAEHLEGTADEVARAFFEYGMDCVDEGTLQLRTRPNLQGRKMTAPYGIPASQVSFSSTRSPPILHRINSYSKALRLRSAGAATRL